ncbi:hypothetical protein [Actinoplanes palleronii]|uniref:Uncharacterized protein n=1 Tax=Actinoplanes palleronii TaxID=113570 RepID=A0ABQ4BKE1_9ACTN|nr:hypothetical protein [Actinoplanes palleronii]GIE70766.1 hypothetical protein Apa02nite_068740 [Actinoplanes palleronii]
MIELTDEMRTAVKRRMGVADGDRLDPWTEAAVEDVLAIVERDQAQATEYTLSALPEEHPEASLFQVKVAYRGRGKWAVIWRSYCINRRGVWDYEPLPSSRTDRWLKAHRFELDEALRLARKALPKLSIHGMTAAEILTTTP